ncbi:MAG: NAD(P)-dependent oxidoreductase [Anaerolineales bacterium]
MTLKVHYVIDPQEDALEILRSELQSNIHLTAGNEIPPHSDCQILVNGTPEPEHLQTSSRLNTLIIPYAGVPVKTRTLLLEYPQLKVYNLHHNAAPTAEMAIALLMAAAKFLVPFDRTFRNHDWTPRYQPNPSLLLEGKTVLILGFGNIGQRVGRFCQALGMDVIGIRHQPTASLIPGVHADVHPPQDLEQILPRVHALIITLPFTPQTEGLIGARQLSLMVPGGLVVNVGRGLIIDQEALYHALEDGTLSSAGLDVWYNYPQTTDERTRTPPADYPFHELENIVMSPHRGGGSSETASLRMHHLAQLLNALCNGEPVPNQVDVKTGY